MRYWRVAGVLFLIGAEALLYGYSYPFFSLALEKRDLANWLIGLNASLAGAGILIVGPFLPRLIRAVGLRHLVGLLFAISFNCFAVMLIADNLIVWFVARFIMGACFAATWTTTEIWLNGVVDDRRRGRIIGASATLYAGCQFLGPVALGVFGVTGELPLIVAMIPLLAGALVALATSGPDGEDDHEESGRAEGFRIAFTVATALVVAAFLCGIGETAMHSLLPLYGLAYGMTDAEASRLVAVFSLGEAVMVAGLGWMADRFGRQFTLRLTSIVAMAACFAIPIAIHAPLLLWPTLFLAGGTVAGLYTLGVVLIGHDFRGQRLVAVSTGFGMSYSAGCIIGATPVGYAIDIFGPNALPVSIGLGFVVLTLFLFLRQSEAEDPGYGADI